MCANGFRERVFSGPPSSGNTLPQFGRLLALRRGAAHWGAQLVSHMSRRPWPRARAPNSKHHSPPRAWLSSPHVRGWVPRAGRHRAKSQTSFSATCVAKLSPCARMGLMRWYSRVRRVQGTHCRKCRSCMRPGAARRVGARSLLLTRLGAFGCDSSGSLAACCWERGPPFSVLATT